MKVVQVSATMRIAIGLAFLSITILLAALTMDMIPNLQDAVAKTRLSVCETIAISTSIHARQDETHRMEATLKAIVSRNPEILSAGIRRHNGRLIVEIGEHQPHWDAKKAETTYATFVSVPVIASNNEPWGTIEVRFTELAEGGLSGFVKHPYFRLMFFFPAASLLLGFVYLRRMLRHVDPSKAVPGRVRSALDTLSGGLLVLDSKARIVLANSAFAKFIEREPFKLQGQRVTDFAWQIADPDAQQPQYNWLKSIEDGHPQPPIMLTLDGPAPRTFLVNTAPIQGESGAYRGVLASFEDVTELQKKELELKGMLEELTKSREEIRRQNIELRELATKDPLTGCLNRRSFFERFESEWSSAERYNHPLSAVMFDLDHFKAVNDNHGHAMGDLVLKKAAAKLREVIRDTDILCRYGGEEFCILLPHLQIDEAAKAAERFRRSISELTFPNELTITASIGVSAISLGGESPHAILEEADKCLYVAKRNGRNQVVQWDEVSEDVEIDDSKISRIQPVEGEVDVAIPFHAVTALISALGYRDSATADHSRRVADLCVTTASRLMTVSETYVLEIAALLHDIGKIGVPDSILLKPGPLTPEEWQIMGVHDRIGVEIVNSAFASRELTEIIETHHAFFGANARHEELPSGVEIPLGARILSIADTYDAIVSDRVYRKGRSQEVAFAELRRCAGTQFDPELVEHFIQAVLDRDENRRQIEQPVSKQAALRIGGHIERLSCAIDNYDVDGLRALGGRLKSTASNDGVSEIADLAAVLECAAGDDTDMNELVHLTNDLLQLCRSTQNAFLSDLPDETFRVVT